MRSQCPWHTSFLAGHSHPPGRDGTMHLVMASLEFMQRPLPPTTIERDTL